MRVFSVVGARPQFVKAAPVGRALAALPGMDHALVHTGQHFYPDMSDRFFHELALPAPAWNLGVHGGGHGAMTGRMLEVLEPLLEAERPDAVLVYGDTTSTLAGALAAAKLGLAVAHVEAGLRSFNRRMPEEINRVLTDHVSTLLYCPTTAAVENLAREGIVAGVEKVGDVMYDAALDAGARARAESHLLERLGLADGTFAVATIHRAENTDDPETLARILDYLCGEAREQPVVLPVHPRLHGALQREGLSLDGLRDVPPCGYLDMHRLLQGATTVYTDSGGLQKEAYFHRTPCVTLRDETEWVETVECGWNRLWQGPDFRPCRAIADYGYGGAARRIATHLGAWLDRRPAGPPASSGARPSA